MSNMEKTVHPGKLLRYLIKRDGCVMTPGAYDALVARANTASNYTKDAIIRVLLFQSVDLVPDRKMRNNP